MTQHAALLALFIWAVVGVSCLQAAWFAWYLLRPRVRRITHCPWCWKQAGIEDEFPAPWTSMLCTYHLREQRARLSARRQVREHRAATTTRPTAVAAREVQG